MQSSKRLLQRLMAIYTVYFLILAGGIIQEFPDARKGFMEGYNDAYREQQAEKAGISHATHYMYANLTGEPEQQIISGNTTFDIAYTYADITMITRNDAPGPGLGFSFFLELLAQLAQLTTLILMYFIIKSIRRSIRDEQPLPRTSISRTRWIGILILGSELLSGISSYMNNRAAESLLAGSGINVDTAFDISYWHLSMGLLILFTAEVFAIGHKLGEEQKLTI